MVPTEQPGRPGMAAGCSPHTPAFLRYPPRFSQFIHAPYLSLVIPRKSLLCASLQHNQCWDYLAPKSPYKALSLGL